MYLLKHTQTMQKKVFDPQNYFDDESDIQYFKVYVYFQGIVTKC